MNEVTYQIWLSFGAFCIIAEILIPGLVMVFVGLGALTVALGIQLGHLGPLSSQFVTFFASSMIYLFTLRLFFLRFVPTNAKKESVDEDAQTIGQIVQIVETIPAGGTGRVEYSDSSWQAESNSDEKLLSGEQVKIVGRHNITWIVEKI